jgi:hypothetical protein
MDSFDVFKPDGTGNTMWVESADTLECAKASFKRLMARRLGIT